MPSRIRLWPSRRRSARAVRGDIGNKRTAEWSLWVHVPVADGIAAPFAEPSSGIRRILVLAPSAAPRQAVERHALPGLSPASTGEPPAEKRQATNRLRDERISGGFVNWPSFMIASSLDLSCRME